MSDIFFSGNWEGEYTYEENYFQDRRDICVAFSIAMEVKDGLVKGHCIDDEMGGGAANPAIIEGFIEGNFISFLKRYDHFWYVEENNKVTHVPSVPSHEVHYSGFFEEDLFVGKWEITQQYIDGDGFSHELAFFGTWTMKKA